MALAAGACAGPAAGTSSAAAAGDGAKASTAAKQKTPWRQLSQYSRKPARKTPWEPDGWREGPGLLSGAEGGFVLYRKGEAGRSADPTKPTKPVKVRR